MKRRWVVAERISKDIISQLLYNRGLKDKNTIANFFNPPTPEVIAAQYPHYLPKISTFQVDKAVNLIKEAIAANRPIVIHGDYDVDGICGTAILYQTLKNLGANVIPFIPNRFDEGYGLSTESLKKIQETTIQPFSHLAIKPLLITTDCGITATDEVKYAKELGFSIIITDHHAKRGNSHAERDTTLEGETLPDADAIVWTDKLAGAGIAWLLVQLLAQQTGIAAATQVCSGLDLVALATIADIQPLREVNRALVKYGLEELNSTPRVGLRELIRVSGLEGKRIGTYEVGWMLAPRLNASGRLQSAMDSLRLLITDDLVEAQNLAAKLNRINQERQQITQQTVDEARRQVSLVEKILVLQKETWHEGIIGLVAGKIREEFYRPAVIISKGERVSKGSARSISGFNIVEAIRQCQEYLIDAGGHALAAGFTVETAKIAQFQERLVAIANEQLSDGDLTPTVKIDAEIRLKDLTWDLIRSLKKFEPFGVGNPRPLFLTRGVEVLNIRLLGSDGQHARLQVRDHNHSTIQPFSHFSCIGFGFGERAAKLSPGDRVDIVYSLEEDTWNGERYLQLKLKDLRKVETTAKTAS